MISLQAEEEQRRVRRYRQRASLTWAFCLSADGCTADRSCRIARALFPTRAGEISTLGSLEASKHVAVIARARASGATYEIIDLRIGRLAWEVVFG